MKRLVPLTLTLLLLLAFSSPALAANWTFVDRHGPDTHYVDTSSVVKANNTLFLWKLAVKDQAVFGVKKILTKLEVDLLEPRRARVLESYLYDENNKELHADKEAEPFDIVRPGTVYEKTINLALKYAKEK